MSAVKAHLDPAVIWHDVECGGYGADLTAWEELAAATVRGDGAADVLDLGCGTGRVAIHLARRGHRVTALDNDASLVGEMRSRAQGLDLEALVDDARELALGHGFGLVAAPMQLVQLMDEADRARLLASMAGHLGSGGLAALAVMDRTPDEWRAGEAGAAPAPDVREHEAWTFSSLPLAIRREPGGVAVHRLRQIVSPEGRLKDEEHVIRLHELTAEQLEAEAARAGLRPAGRRAIPETEDHVGSVVVVLEAGS